MDLLSDLFVAYYDARKNKRSTANQMKFEIEYEKKLIDLYHEIKERRYEVSPSICFVVDKPVKREIFAADFRDRIIHHLIYNYVNEFFDGELIDDSYSCRTGKGTLYGIRRIENFIKECSNGYTRDCYILKLDIRGYFMSIDKSILYTILEDYIYKMEEAHPEKFTSAHIGLILYLIKITLDCNPVDNCKIKGKRSDWDGLPRSKSLFHLPEGKGLPIGNLTSQLFSNIYLNCFDKFVKETLCMEYYGRYVDDFVIVHQDKALLKGLIGEIKNFLANDLELELHPQKIYLQHYTKGVNFLGATIKPHRTYISKRTKKNFIQCIDFWNRRLARADNPGRDELELMRACINSYLGLMGHHFTYNIRKKILLDRPNLFFKYGYLTKGLQKFVLKKAHTKKNYNTDKVKDMLLYPAAEYMYEYSD